MFTLINTILLIVLIVIVSRKKVVIQIEETRSFQKKDHYKK